MSHLQQQPNIRLECLKLAHRPDRSPQEVIATAREYLAWVGGALVPTTGESQPGDSQKEGKAAPTVSARTSLKKSGESRTV